MKIIAVSEVSGGSYCNRNTNSGTETDVAKLNFIWYPVTISSSQEFSAFFICCKWKTVLDYIWYNNDSKCQLMMMLPNQFNNRTDFWIISISWLWLFPNLIPCSFDIFDKKAFIFVGIKLIVFFLFNFQYWVRIKIGSWYYLTCFTSLFLSHFSCVA